MADDHEITETFDDSGDSWSAYSRRLKRSFIANKVNEVTKVAMTLGLVGNETSELLHSLCSPVKPIQKTFGDIDALLENYFGSSHTSILSHRYQFFKREQKSNEKIADYVKELERLSKPCRFGTHRKEQLRDRLVCGIRCQKTLRRLLTEDSLSYEFALHIATEMETTHDDCIKEEFKSGPDKQTCSENLSQMQLNPSFEVSPELLETLDMVDLPESFGVDGERETVVDGSRVKIETLESDSSDLDNVPGDTDVASLSRSVAATAASADNIPGDTDVASLSRSDATTAASAANSSRNAPDITLRTCKQCGLAFEKLHGLNIHMARVHPEKPPAINTTNHSPSKRKDANPDQKSLTCEKCGQVFHTKPGLKQHVTIMHIDRGKSKAASASDVTEPEDFSEVNVVNSTAKASDGVPSKSCEYCGKVFKTIRSVRTHALRAHPGKAKKLQYHCEKCDKFFTYRMYYEWHMAKHSNVASFKCDICHKSFKLKHYLVRHMRTHTGVKSHKCPICSKAFLERAHLNLHVLIHSDEKRYKCVMCDIGFKQPASLYSHTALHHSVPKKIRCDTCGKSYRRRHYKEHLKTHRESKPYKCTLCDRQFNFSGSLRQHKRIHTGEMPYPCDECDERFRQSGSLKRHKMNRHGMPKPYQCTECGLEFCDRGGFNRHSLTHTNV